MQRHPGSAMQPQVHKHIWQLFEQHQLIPLWFSFQLSFIFPQFPLRIDITQRTYSIFAKCLIGRSQDLQIKQQARRSIVVDGRRGRIVSDMGTKAEKNSCENPIRLISLIKLSAQKMEFPYRVKTYQKLRVTYKTHYHKTRSIQKPSPRQTFQPTPQRFLV